MGSASGEEWWGRESGNGVGLGGGVGGRGGVVWEGEVEWWGGGMRGGKEGL